MKLVIAWLLGVPLGVAATGALLSVRMVDVFGPSQRVEATNPGASSRTTLPRTTSRTATAEPAAPGQAARRGAI